MPSGCRRFLPTRLRWWLRGYFTERRVGDRYGGERRSNDAEEVELQKLFSAPIRFELRAEHPQGKHVEQEMKKSGMHEGISGELPERAVRDQIGNQAQQVNGLETQVRGENLQ